MAEFVPAILVALAALVAGSAAGYASPASGEMGVFFAPWVSTHDAITAIAAAGGGLANSTRLGNVFVAYAPDEGFVDRVRAQGAWFTVAAHGLCEPLEGESTNES